MFFCDHVCQWSFVIHVCQFWGIFMTFPILRFSEILSPVVIGTASIRRSPGKCILWYLQGYDSTHLEWIFKITKFVKLIKKWFGFVCFSDIAEILNVLLKYPTNIYVANKFNQPSPNQIVIFDGLCTLIWLLITKASLQLEKFWVKRIAIIQKALRGLHDNLPSCHWV